MEETTYRLRPHHVSLMLRLAMIDESRREGYVRRSINDYFNEEDETYALFELKVHGRPLKYNQQFVENLIGFYKSLLGHDDAMVRIVDGLDDICALGCNRKIAKCEKESDESIRKMEKFNLHVGDVFPLSEIMKG